LPHLLCATLLPPPTSPLFPYTTLFRSDLLAARGQEDHRHLAEGSDPPAHLEAADVRQAHVQHQHVHAAGAHPLHRLLPEQAVLRSEEHTSELQSRENLVCRLLLEKKKK